MQSVSKVGNIVPIAMIKRYQHGRFFRILWAILAPATLGLGLLFWAIWPDTGRGWLLVVELFVGLYALYAAWSLLATYADVSLSPTELTVSQLGRTVQIPYESIQSVRRSQVALIVKSANQTIWIERHIDKVFDLMGELKYRAPALRIDRQALIQQPLPQTVNGRLQAFLFGLLLAIVMMAVGGGIIWSAFEETGLTIAVKIFFGLWPLLISGLFFHLSFYFTWRLTLQPDKILIRHSLHTRTIPLKQLQAAQLITTPSNRGQAKDSVVLLLSLANGRSLRITQQEMARPLEELLDMMVYHYQLAITFKKESAKIHHTQFGAGSRRPFTHYLEGESHIKAESIDDICDWLRQCKYVRDEELFNQRDVWQHPGEFEALKKGDCEDHALWAWRKLIELDIPTEFVVGRIHWGNDDGVQSGAHAWLVFWQDGRSYLLETTHKRQLIYEQEKVQTKYHPWFSVDQELNTFRFSPIAESGSLPKK